MNNIAALIVHIYLSENFEVINWQTAKLLARMFLKIPKEKS